VRRTGALARERVFAFGPGFTSDFATAPARAFTGRGGAFGFATAGVSVFLEARERLVEGPVETGTAREPLGTALCAVM